jgi:antitoxin component YwqK of YwqJK toxin-antitoxin module
MKSILSLTLTLITIIGYCQSKVDYNNIDTDYQDFIKDTSIPITETVSIKKHITILPSENFQANHNSTFAIQTSTGQQEVKLNAAILYAISNSVDYEFVADLFNKSARQNSFVLKEMLRLSISEIPDTSSIKIKKKEILNDLETLVQYDINKIKTLKKPILITFFSSIQETNSVLEKTQKIQISHNDIVLFESKKRNHLLKICNTQNKLNLSNHNFVYGTNDTETIVRGGLWHHILSKKLKEISHQIFEKSAVIKQVNDLHSVLNNDLKRSVSTGTTKKHQIELHSFFSSNFESTITFELENNKEQIVERYNKFYKKSEINLQNSIKNGFSKTWNKSGNLTKTAFFENGLLEGDYKEFFNDLSPRIKTNYNKGKISNSYIEYFQNGNISKYFKYKKGVKYGTQKEYHKNGNIKQKGKYKKNQPTGWHSYYDSYGNRFKKCKFKNGIIKKNRDYN